MRLVARAWDYLGGVNTQTETDVHDVLNTFGTAALGSLPFALIGGREVLLGLDRS
jgi:hypothetical protein